MSTRVTVEGTFEFIRAGEGAKTGRPYLMVSNGRNEVFINLPKDVELAEFAKYQEGDDINLRVNTLLGSDRLTFVAIVD